MEIIAWCPPKIRDRPETGSFIRLDAHQPQLLHNACALFSVRFSLYLFERRRTGPSALTGLGSPESRVVRQAVPNPLGLASRLSPPTRIKRNGS